jgi:hypothetical protein
MIPCCVYIIVIGVRKIPGLTKRIRECVPVPWTPPPSSRFDSDPKLQIAEFPDESSPWFSMGDRNLFIRHHYLRIWEHIEELYQNHRSGKSKTSRCRIMGQPGIGKTVSANYYLLRAVQAGYPVLLETQRRRFWFSSDVDDTEIELLTESRLQVHARRKDVLFLHDHQRGRQPPIIRGGAFVVAPMSPDITNYHDFGKDSCRELWMPLPTKDELWAMNLASTSQRPREQFEQLCDTYGLRLHIILGDEDAIKRAGQAQVAGLYAFDLHKFLRTGGGIMETFRNTSNPEGQPWSVVQVDASEDYLHPTALAFVTPAVQDIVLIKECVACWSARAGEDAYRGPR